jgi:hypothetical protein
LFCTPPYATERIAAGWIATGKWRVHALVEWSLCPALMEPKEPPGVGASFFQQRAEWRLVPEAR